MLSMLQDPSWGFMSIITTHHILSQSQVDHFAKSFHFNDLPEHSMFFLTLHLHRSDRFARLQRWSNGELGSGHIQGNGPALWPHPFLHWKQREGLNCDCPRTRTHGIALVFNPDGLFSQSFRHHKLKQHYIMKWTWLQQSLLPSLIKYCKNKSTCVTPFCKSSWQIVTVE